MSLSFTAPLVTSTGEGGNSKTGGGDFGVHGLQMVGVGVEQGGGVVIPSTDPVLPRHIKAEQTNVTKK